MRDRPDLRSKVCLLKGDLLSSQPCLGIPEEPGPVAAGAVNVPPTMVPVRAAASSISSSASSRAVHNHGLSHGHLHSHNQGLDDSTPSHPSGAGGAGAAGRPHGSAASSSTGLDALGSFADDGGVWDAAGRRVCVGGMAQLRAEPRLVVIHSAARIALEDPIQVTLRHNYVVRGLWSHLSS